MGRRGDHAAWDDATILSRFDSEAEELLTQRRLVRDGLRTQFSISIDGSGLSMSATEHDPEEVLAYLGALRRFLLSDETVFVNRVSAVLRRHITDPELIAALDGQTRWWNRKQWAPQHKFVWRDAVNGTEATVTGREVFDLYLYGKVAHVDEEKARRLALLRETMPTPMVSDALMVYIVKATDHVGSLISVLRYAKRNGKWSDAPVEHPRGESA